MLESVGELTMLPSTQLQEILSLVEVIKGSLLPVSFTLSTSQQATNFMA